MQLVNKNIVITGVTSGIGLKLVERLQRDNFLYVIARNNDKLRDLKQRFPAVNIFRADLSCIEDIADLVNRILIEIDTVDLLINNAAQQNTKYFLDDAFEYHAIHREINTNFTAVCCLCFHFLPALMQAKSAAILNINSGLALAPKTSSAVYCASKSALNAFSKSLSYQLTNTNISVMQAFLPVVDTAMTFGRGESKMDVNEACEQIIAGLKGDVLENDIGKVKFLRLLLRLLPSLAHSIMRKY